MRLKFRHECNASKKPLLLLSSLHNQLFLCCHYSFKIEIDGSKHSMQANLGLESPQICHQPRFQLQSVRGQGCASQRSAAVMWGGKEEALPTHWGYNIGMHVLPSAADVYETTQWTIGMHTNHKTAHFWLFFLKERDVHSGKLLLREKA